jgi:hypothetical protein
MAFGGNAGGNVSGRTAAKSGVPGPLFGRGSHSAKRVAGMEELGCPIKLQTSRLPEGAMVYDVVVTMGSESGD